ncbi:hypothetical protein ACJ3XI_09790 [Litorimonas sp. RW-G-Af-16]|uniref:hypothetical protein n=1 Tax=Litorimonas sp. RW-G-Af-16 TaxID=3241168 RepID=UPI00390CBC0B
MPKSDAPKPPKSRLDIIADAAEIYGARSFDNYAQIRSVAETIRDEFCAWLDPESQCVFLVPAEGAFAAQNYRSAAFSVTGTGYLPLKPISFGLAVKISREKDYMRLKITCRKEGGNMFISIEHGRDIALPLPIQKGELPPLFESIYSHILDFFTDSVDEYDNGDYGSSDIGFDILRMAE